MLGGPKEKPSIGLLQHCRIIVRITSRNGTEIQGFESGHGVSLWIHHPHVIRDDPSTPVNLQLIAEESWEPQLSHQRFGKLIERIG